jgi:hypothetical protein
VLITPQDALLFRYVSAHDQGVKMIDCTDTSFGGEADGHTVLVVKAERPAISQQSLHYSSSLYPIYQHVSSDHHWSDRMWSVSKYLQMCRSQLISSGKCHLDPSYSFPASHTCHHPIPSTPLRCHRRLQAFHDHHSINRIPSRFRGIPRFPGREAKGRGTYWGDLGARY